MKTLQPVWNTEAVLQRAELYYMMHPGSPSAESRPAVGFRSGLWVVLLGKNITEGITGFGSNIEAALSAFDRHYLSKMRPPV